MTPSPVIVLVPVPVPAAGSPKFGRQVKPAPYPVQRRDQPHQLRQPIPKHTPNPAQIEALRRAGKAMLETTRAQRRA